jgi:ABC-type nitrate/sulfonate/bicarbonate transport system substrate-binding protein
MVTQKSIRLIIPLLLAALSLSACLIQAQEKSPPPPTEAVTLGLAPALNYLTLIALDQGYFSDEGLDVTVVEYSTGSRVLRDGLLAGEVEVGVIGLGPLVFGSFERDDFEIFGSISTLFDLYQVVARKDRAILAPADLKGKRLATSKASTFHYFVHNFLIENGLTDEEVTFSFKPAAELPAALASGEVDAISAREPFIAQAQNLLGDNAVVLAAPDLPANTLNLVALDPFLQNRPQVAERILRALIRAEDLARQQPDRAIEIVAHRLEAPEAEIAGAWPKVALQVSLDQELILSLENIARWAIKNELTETTDVPNYLDYIYLGALETVDPEAVTIIH